MKKQLIALGIILVLLAVGLSGCSEERKSSYRGNTEEGIEENSFEVDESKNKLAVLIKKDGFYDTIEIQEKLNDFIQAVKQDIDIDNVGISHVDADSVDELDAFVEELYHEKDVGYIIMVGKDLVWTAQGWKKIHW